MSEPNRPIVYSSDREWIAERNVATREHDADHPMYVLTTKDYGTGAALWNVDGNHVLVYQDLSVALAGRTGITGEHELFNYVDLFLAGPEQLMEILWHLGYHWDYHWLTYDTAAPPNRKKESS